MQVSQFVTPEDFLEDSKHSPFIVQAKTRSCVFPSQDVQSTFRVSSPRWMQCRSTSCSNTNVSLISTYTLVRTGYFFALVMVLWYAYVMRFYITIIIMLAVMVIGQLCFTQSVVFYRQQRYSQFHDISKRRPLTSDEFAELRQLERWIIKYRAEQQPDIPAAQSLLRNDDNLSSLSDHVLVSN